MTIAARRCVFIGVYALRDAHKRVHSLSYIIRTPMWLSHTMMWLVSVCLRQLQEEIGIRD